MKAKHPELSEGYIKRGRGRPRKYPISKKELDFGCNKYDNFFTLNNRGPSQEMTIRILNYTPQSRMRKETVNHPKVCKSPRLEEGKIIDLNSLIQDIFKFIYKGENSDKIFSKPNNYKDNPILNNISIGKEISKKDKKEKTCDDVFL